MAPVTYKKSYSLHSAIYKYERKSDLDQHILCANEWGFPSHIHTYFFFTSINNLCVKCKKNQGKRMWKGRSHIHLKFSIRESGFCPKNNVRLTSTFAGTHFQHHTVPFVVDLWHHYFSAINSTNNYISTNKQE